MLKREVFRGRTSSRCGHVWSIVVVSGATLTLPMIVEGSHKWRVNRQQHVPSVTVTLLGMPLPSIHLLDLLNVV